MNRAPTLAEATGHVGDMDVAGHPHFLTSGEPFEIIHLALGQARGPPAEGVDRREQPGSWPVAGPQKGGRPPLPRWAGERERSLRHPPPPPPEPAAI